MNRKQRRAKSRKQNASKIDIGLKYQISGMKSTYIGDTIQQQLKQMSEGPV